MNGGPSGFSNAPVTRFLVISCAVLTILFGIRGRASSLGLSYQDIITKLQLWRLIVSALAFSSTPELMFGLYLLYYFRLFERQIGSNKYSVFVLFSMVTATLFEILALALFKDPSSKLVASGPYGLIFSCFMPFYFDVPVSTRLRIFGFRFSDKSFIYLAGVQLLFSSWKRSLIPGIAGFLAGVIYHLNVLHIRRIKFPDFITFFFSRLPWLSSGGSPSSTPSGSFVRRGQSHAGDELEGLLNHPPSASRAVMEPPEESISTLVSMGFDRNMARQALQRARNDVNAATNILLEMQSR